MIAARRAVVLAALALIAYACVFPQAAFAHMGDHGKTVFFHDVYIRPDEVVDGDLNVIFGNAQIAGTVRGDVNTLFGHCVKLEDAEIDGKETCVTDDAARAIAPWLIGASTFDTFAQQDKRILYKLGANAIVLLVFLLFPLRMRLALDRVERHPGIAALIGSIAAIAAVPFAIVLVFTIIGIPLIVLEAAALVAGIWLGTGAIALLVGRRLAELVWPAHTPSPLWALVLGLVIVSAAETVPIVGWVVTALVWLMGLGSAILSFVPAVSVESIRRVTVGGPPMHSRPM